MTQAIVFAVIATVQGLFLLLLFLFLLVRGRYDRHHRAALAASRAEVAVPLRAWLVAGAHPEGVVRAIRALPQGTAIGYAALLARQTIPEAQRGELAEALRGEVWIATAIAQRKSRFWWRRLEAARALSLIGGEREREAIQALLSDTHPAVQIAAIAALPRVADEALLGRVLDGLVRFPPVVRRYLTSVLLHSRSMIGPPLAGRIAGGGADASLRTWIDLADTVNEPSAIRATMVHAAHAAPDVRWSVARALRRLPGPATQQVLVALLADADVQVRASAARSLGELGAVQVVPQLAPLLGDSAWIVRLRAAVALAQAGERGRAALHEARDGQDAFAAAMAAMVVGLSDGALLELGDG